MIRIESASAPFTIPRIGLQAVQVLGRADAMGLLPREEEFVTLDMQSLRTLLRCLARAGIGINFLVRAEAGATIGAVELEQDLRCLNLALEESPAPEFEWERLSEILGIELLTKLMAVSASSVRRYKAAARTTPDDIAGRLHFLSLVAGDLGGAYNDFGIRQWFGRKRAQLGGRAPEDFLKGAWKPEQTGPRQVRELARALTASPAT